jgi:hypothetical protein
MAKNIFKSASLFLLLALTISACGTNTDLTPLNPEQNTVTTFSADDISIINQIKANIIQETEWGAQVKNLPQVGQAKKATLLSYLAFANDKGGWRNELPPTLNIHESAGSSGMLNLLIESYGGQENDGKRYYVVPDNDKNKIVSPYIQFNKQIDSADYRVLRDYIKWGFSTYPSRVKLLTIDNHGGAYLGIARDDNSGKVMPLPALATAIRTSAGRVDVLSLDACLMSTIEVGYELKDVADIMVGSEDSTIGAGMMYAAGLSQIIAQSSSNEEIATGILLASDRKGAKDITLRPNKKGKIPNVFTISAFRGSQMENVAHEINNLAKLLLSRLTSQKQAAKMAINGTHPLNVDGDDSNGQRDLYEVLNRINVTTSDPDVKMAVANTKNALNKSIIIARAHNAEKYAQGMAINISPVSVQSPEYQATAFAKATLWDELITAVNK